LKQRFELFFLAIFLLITVGGATSSAAATAPAIAIQPANATVKVGTAATFNVIASGTTPLTYKWYKNGALVSTQTTSNTAKYTTPVTTDADNNASFTVVVSNSAGSTPPSNPATLTVVDITIGLQPASQTVTTPAVAQFISFAYTPQGQQVTCQWYKNAKAIPGATECYQYTTEETTTADNGAAFTVIFTVTVNGVAITATSQAAILTVKSSTPTGTYPIVGNWSGTATITNPASSTINSQVVAAFSQTSYSLTGTVVFTDENGIPNYGVAVASLNGQNLYVAASGEGAGGIAGGFTANLLTLNLTGGVAGGNITGQDSTEFGSGTLTISADHKTLKGTGTDSDGDSMTWKLTRE
jgi:hypothetical protein